MYLFSARMQKAGEIPYVLREFDFYKLEFKGSQ